MTVTVADDGGVGVDTLTVTVLNVAPAVDAGVDQTADEGAAVSLDPGTFTDPGADDTHTATIDWGDGAVETGTVEQAAGTVIGNHVYGDNGTYTVTVALTDDDGGTGSGALLVTVGNVAPIVTAGTDQTVLWGEIVSIASVFTDPGILDTHTAVVDWGDGTVEAGGVVEADGSGTVSGSHVFYANAAHTVTDDDGGSHSDTLLVTVSPRWTDDPGDVGREGDELPDDIDDADITSGDASNDDTKMTIVIRVLGGISDRYKYRLKLTLASGATYQLTYDRGKVKGLPQLKAEVNGNELTFTIRLSSIGLASGDIIQVSFETQAGVKAAGGIGIPDQMPDSGHFDYVIR